MIRGPQNEKGNRALLRNLDEATPESLAEVQGFRVFQKEQEKYSLRKNRYGSCCFSGCVLQGP